MTQTLNQLQCLFSGSFFLRFPKEYKHSHPFGIPIRKMWLLRLEDGMLLQTLGVEQEQLTLWKWTGFVEQNWDVYFLYLFAFLSTPDRLPGFRGRECISVMSCL